MFNDIPTHMAGLMNDLTCNKRIEVRENNGHQSVSLPREEIRVLKFS
jgi:hypothetical protein